MLRRHFQRCADIFGAAPTKFVVKRISAVG
jgi:hypothetical protein